MYFLHVPEHISLCSLISSNVYWPIPLCWGSFCSMTVAILVSQTAQRKGFIISSLSYDLLVLHCCDSSNMPFATDAMKVLVRLWVYGRECNESMNFGAPTGPPESHQSDSLLLHHDFSTKIPSWWSSCSEFFQWCTDQPFPPQIPFGNDVYHNRNETRIHISCSFKCTGANIYCLRKLPLYLEITILFHFEIYTMGVMFLFLNSFQWLLLSCLLLKEVLNFFYIILNLFIHSFSVSVCVCVRARVHTCVCVPVEDWRENRVGLPRARVKGDYKLFLVNSGNQVNSTANCLCS